MKNFLLDANVNATLVVVALAMALVSFAMGHNVVALAAFCVAIGLGFAFWTNL